jgi:nucleotide-binding universal stress UspA family protein
MHVNTGPVGSGIFHALSNSGVPSAVTPIELPEITILRNILVHIPTARPVRPVVDVSISLAVQARAHLDAIAVGYESMSAIGSVAEPAAAVAALIEREQQRAEERASAAIAVFATEAKCADIDYATRTVAAPLAEAEEELGRLARLYDLTVVSQPDPSYPGFDSLVPEAVLFNSGAPMLMVPYIHKGPLNTQSVGVAWDGSRLAARALRDALSFLRGAKSVTLIAVNEDRASDVAADKIASHLARRRINTKIERLVADRRDVPGTIVSVVADCGIDLLVMGGYGHSRFKERVLGGVTKGMFDSMVVPTLMSH